jgi:methanogenic corrinoid protein MtbC1
MSGVLNIAALSRRTGVAPDTLRKWEHRYGILCPSRTAGGQRRYDERDVARVEWLRERLREGYRIGEAATLLGRVDVGCASGSPAEQADAILDAVAAGRHDEVGSLLDQAFALHGVEATLEHVLEPLLRAVGERWAAGTLGVADEHLVSEGVRARLGHLLSDGSGDVHGRVVLACAPGERHELGLMTVGIALRRDGWDVAYLGADTPLDDALDVARRTSARVLGISVTTAERADALERPRDAGVPLVVGGQAADAALARRLGASHAAAATALRQHAA